MRSDEKYSFDADKIFINGVIYSIDNKYRVYEAMAIKNEKIAALGTNEDIKGYFNKVKEVINLNFRAILPGFINAQCNMLERIMIKKDGLSLFQGKNSNEYLNLIQSYIESHPKEKIIYGIGWRNSDFYRENESLNEYNIVFKGPNRKWIDKIKTDKPIVLKACNNHSLLLNSNAFEYFNITKDTKISIGGKVEVNENGELWGTLKENAMNLVDINEIQTYKENEYMSSFIRYQSELHSCGITTISSIDKEDGKMPLELYRRLEMMEKLKLRIVYGNTIMPKETCKRSIYEQIHQLKRDRIIYKTELFDISIAKLFADGIIENMTAYMFKPYEQIDKFSDEIRGEFLWHKDEFEEAIKMVNMLEFNAHIHAVGDLACKLAIDGIEYSSKNNINMNCRNSLINIDLITKYYIWKMKELSINAIVKPFWFYKDINSSKNEVLAIGGQRAYRQYPLKSLIDGGVVAAAASDLDVLVETNPLNAIECAVLRNLYDFIVSGYPETINMNDPRYRLNPNERISVLEAIKMFTINAAYILGKEKEIGSLEVGKKADFIVLDRDIFNVKLLDISNINIQRTYFNGELVYLNE